MRYFSVPLDEALHDKIKSLAHEQGVSAAEIARSTLRDALMLKSSKPTATPVDESNPNPQGCPATATPCKLPNHYEAEGRISCELPPSLRRKIAPRAPSEGPHEYIARFWASEEIKRDLFVDLHKALGWIKDDDGDQADYD